MSKCHTAYLILLKFFVLANSVLVYESPGLVKIGYVIHQCNFDHQIVVRSLVHSSIWLQRRINQLESDKLEKNVEMQPLGLEVHKVCSRNDYLKTLFDLYIQSNKSLESGQSNGLLGVVIISHDGIEADENFKFIKEFANLLDFKVENVRSSYQEQILASVKVLEALNLTDLYVVAPNQDILKLFYKFTRRDWVCVKNFDIFHHKLTNDLELFNTSSPTIIFGSGNEISNILEKIKNDDPQLSILVPLDGNEIIGAPETSIILEPIYSDFQEDYQEENLKILPSSILLELANQFLKYTKHLSETIDYTCLNNSTNDTSKCLKYPKTVTDDFTIEQIISLLKIDPLSHEFAYNFVNMDNTTKKTIVFTYSILDGSLNYTNPEFIISNNRMLNETTHSCFNEFERCILECENFKSFEFTNLFKTANSPIGLRQEPWVFAFLSISIFGIVLCIAILSYIINRLCKKQVLEGNPILTILLLIDVIVLYLSVIPFILDGDKSSRKVLLLLRSLLVTIPYTFAFALLLSRTILLATVSKEIGFMSHIAGSVQGFLTLFIFAVQAAFTLQLFNDAQQFAPENSHSMLYLMSYNVMLLVLLTFISPLIIRSRRNYREGKYFTISIALLAISWSFWLPCYGVLDEIWKDPVLCFGLVSTATILLGGIFIPRTYLMTVAAARDRFTSTLPSLATATSAMDIYRASTQPVYDCVNVAAVAAANLRAEHLRQQQQLQRNQRQNCSTLSQSDFYTTHIPDGVMPDPEVDDDDDFDVTNCDSPPPPPNDKITRF